PAERGTRARLEARLRGDVRSKVPFAVAYRSAGLADWLRKEAPAVGAALAAGLAEVAGTRRATPTQWARLWQRALRRLDWRAADDVDGERRWQPALDELARLTPVLGAVSPGAALAELERILDRPDAAVLPLEGIHVLERVDDVGPGYAAAWLTGFTDTYWPQPARPNPLLPRPLQRAHGMPWSSPADATRRSAESLARVLRWVPDVVASWPGRVYDYETEPSPALAAWPEIASAELDALVRPRHRAAPRARESLRDAAPPLGAPEIRGGAGVLRRQARCPLRAFAEHRLGARELERRSQGLTARQRGIVTHHALELLLIDQPSQAELAARRGSIAGCVERALDAVFHGARDALRPLYDLERERLGAVLARLLEADAQRAPFAVVAIEEEREIAVAGRVLRVRIDRLDRLADGRVAIIDHKTGKEAGPNSWLRERPRDLQVPLYAAYSPEPVTAAAIARLHGRDAAYVGLWEAGTFPARPGRLPDGVSWAAQLDVWRRQIEHLVGELAGGDTRLLLDDLDDARGSFAPLSRVAEQLALARGGLSPW
ncbi:MAG TPA: PD-(D/E)XK nuclease family protein, partial [Gammaproteobacteria bacterium]|nr:PD-(D/E)XK nuclease family protein [Gammaproteobacteria bacterium]